MHDDTRITFGYVNLITEHEFLSDLPRNTCVFLRKRRDFIMPKNQFQRMVFAFITVLITVHAYILYSLCFVNGNVLMEINGTNSVIDAVNKQGGIYMLGNYAPIWLVVIVEFVLAYTLENVLGSPLSFKIALKHFDPQKTNPMIFETVIISATVAIMCPAMSFLAAFLYYPYYEGFNLLILLGNWFKLVCYNLPFAFFSQLLFIQPLVRKVFRLIFVRSDTIKNKEFEAEQVA